MYRSYHLSEHQSNYLVERLRESNGAAKTEIAERLGIAHPRYVFILYQRITGRTLSAEGFGTSNRWGKKAMKKQRRGNGHQKSRVPKGQHSCPVCDLLIPVELIQCEDHGIRILKGKPVMSVKQWCTVEDEIVRSPLADIRF